MLEFVKETKSCWDFLRETKLPVFIYGMGNGAEKILRQFDRCGIPVAGFFASDEFVRGHYFKGHLVHSLSQIESIIDDFIIVLGFGAGYRSLYDRIVELSKKHPFYAPDLPVYDEEVFDVEYMNAHAEEIQAVYDLLADERSRELYASIINYRLSGKIEYLLGSESLVSEDYSDIIKPTADSVFCDLGAFNGDTVTEFFTAANGIYSKIIAVEPSEKNFRRLQKNMEELGFDNVELVNAAAEDFDGVIDFSAGSGRMQSVLCENGDSLRQTPAIKADTLLEGITAPIIIKYDVEGGEQSALIGSEKSIKNGAKLVVSLYHKTGDIFTIPLWINKLVPDRKLYIRKRLYIPAWDVNLIVLP